MLVYSWRRSGEGNGNPVQHSCLENPMDRGAWQATVYGIARLRHDWATNTHTKGGAEGRVEFGLQQGPNSICTADLSLLWILMWKGPANITPQRLYLGSFNRVHGSTVSPRAPPGNTHQWLARPSAPLLFHLRTIGIARLSSQKLISGSKSKQTQLFDLLSF